MCTSVDVLSIPQSRPYSSRVRAVIRNEARLVFGVKHGVVVVVRLVMVDVFVVVAFVLLFKLLIALVVLIDVEDELVGFIVVGVEVVVLMIVGV